MLGAELPGLSSRFEVVRVMFAGACETYRVKIRTSLSQLGMNSSSHVMEECKLPTLSYAHCRDPTENLKWNEDTNRQHARWRPSAKSEMEEGYKQRAGQLEVPGP